MTTALAGIALAGAVQLFALQTRKLQGHSFRVEAQQALRASLDAITRDVRLAGANLPLTGAYIPLAGTEGGAGPDSITIRTGVLRGNLSFVQAGLTANMNQGATVAQVANTTGFTPAMLVYLTTLAGNGQFAFVTNVGANTLTLDTAASSAYAASISTIFAIDERTYAVDTSIPGTPRLMLTVNRGTPQAFAAGVRDLQIRYVLNQNCPPCDVVNAPAPANTATWRLVNDVLITATIQTVGTVRSEDAVSFTEASRAKPRNLLP